MNHVHVHLQCRSGWSDVFVVVAKNGGQATCNPGLMSFYVPRLAPTVLGATNINTAML